jgi:hypothetical protein
MPDTIRKRPILALAILLALAALGFYAVNSFAATWTILTPPVTPQVVSASGGAQANAATITSAVGRMAYIEGFDVTGGGATAAGIVNITTSGLANNLTYSMNVLAGVTGPVNAQGGVFLRFPTPIPASGTNTNITVTLPSLGAGNTNASITVYGFTQ